MDCFLLQSSIPYTQYIDFQTRIRTKRKECILILEHPCTITAGINHNQKNLLVPKEILESKGISLIQVSRGGDFTAHEPGQIVLYPHIDLKKRNLSLVDFLQLFRGTLNRSILKIWGLRLIDNPENPGLYLYSEPEKKLVSFGVYFKSFFTSFGAALNWKNSLETFQYINPCGGLSQNMVSIEKLGLDSSLGEDFKYLFLDMFLAELQNRKSVS
jgi:lipoyl(octanoyl) transferase